MKPQETVKISMHSVIDLITNSSTEIYTFSHKSIAACKEMVDEFFKVAGINKTCDDIFDLSLDEGEDPCGFDGEFPAESFLIITPKRPEYTNLAILVRQFLYSPDHEGTYMG